MDKTPKEKLRTSLDVYNRLKWDSQFDEENILIGYEDRFAGSMEIEYQEYHVGGDIPFHRIYYFRKRSREGTVIDVNDVIWDRRQRIDHVFHSGYSKSSNEGVHAGKSKLSREENIQMKARNEEMKAAEQETILAIERAIKRTEELRLEELEKRLSKSKGKGKGKEHQRHFDHQHQIPDYATMEPHPQFKWNNDSQNWEESQLPLQLQLPQADAHVRGSGSGGNRIKLISFNALSDCFEDVKDEVPETSIRMHHLVEALKRECDNSDTNGIFICLQEVTTPMLIELMSNPWIQTLYSSIGFEQYHADSQLKPFGQVIFSSLPMRVHHIRYSFLDYKSAVLVEFGSGMKILNLHLVSNMHGVDRSDVRARMMVELAKVIPGHLEDIILVGDFNVVDGPEKALEIWPTSVKDWIDIAASLGPTFNSAVNRLANLIAPDSDPKRIDAVLLNKNNHGRMRVVHGSEHLIHPNYVDGEGDGESEDVFSDHSGISVEFEYDNDNDSGSRSAVAAGVTVPVPTLKQTMLSSPVYKSAIALVPPKSLWAGIQAIRKKYDPAYTRWPPHINLIYGFVPSEFHAAAARAIRPVLQNFEPFEVDGENVGFFQHRKSATLYLSLRESDVEKLRAIQSRLQAMFPNCSETTDRGDSGFTPHLTIAKIKGTFDPDRQPKHRDLMALARQLASKTGSGDESLKFTVKSLVILGRDGFSDPFSVREKLMLGGCGEDGIDWIPTPASAPALISHSNIHDYDYLSPIHRKAFESIHSIIGECDALSLSDLNLNLRPIGSAVLLGEYEPQSDLDCELLVLVPVSGKMTIDKLGRDISDKICEVQCDNSNSPSSSRYIGNGMIRCRIKVNIEGAGTGVGAEKPEIDVDISIRGIDVDSNVHVQEASKSNELMILNLQFVREHLDTYRQALCAVRRWAKRRGIYGNDLGLLNGISLAIMVAKICDEIDDDGVEISAEHLVRRFFDTYASWDWSKCVQIHSNSTSDDQYKYEGQRAPRMPVISPAKLEDCMWRATASSASRIRNELARAAQLCDLRTISESLACSPLIASYLPSFWDSFGSFIVVTPQSTEASDVLDSSILRLIVGLEQRCGLENSSELMIGGRMHLDTGSESRCLSIVIGIAGSSDTIAIAREVLNAFVEELRTDLEGSLSVIGSIYSSEAMQEIRYE